MKRALVILAALTTVTAVAQNKAVDALNKKLEKANATIAKKATASALIERANIYMDLAEVYTNKIIPGYPIDQYISSAGQPESMEEIVSGGERLNKYSFANVDIYASPDNNEIQFWLAKTVEDPQALDKAYKDLLQAKQTDAKEFSTKGIIPVGKLANLHQIEGMAYYSLMQREKAGEMFENSAMVSEELTNNVDTVMVFYAGVSYYDAGNNDAKALELMKKAADNGYEADGDTYFSISALEERMGNTDAAIAILRDNLEKFPSNNLMLSQLINLSLNSDTNLEETLSLLKKAEETDPTNASFYLTEASIHDRMGNETAAEEALIKAYELDSNNFMTIYNIGITRARKGDSFINEAKKLDVNDIEAYNTLIEQSLPYYNGAIEMLEKAHELDPMDARVAQTLRTLYYNKRDDSPEMEGRYNYYDKLYQELQK